MPIGELTHLSLFSGIGGLDLAAEWAGLETVGQCEWADFPTKVLEKHWPEVPRWRDIRTLNKEDFYERTGRGTVDVISGGFPCQPFSVAGNQKGKEDERYLWPEMLRVIRELTPRWVIGENVSGILQIAAADVVKDLERIGYNVAVFNFEAAAVGARHRRERVFFVGNAEHDGHITEQKLRSDEAAGHQRREKEQEAPGKFTGASRPTYVPSLRGSEGGSKRDDVANADSEGLQRRKESRNACGCWANGDKQPPRCNPSGNRWATEPDVGRVAHGVPSRVDRLKCLGNAVVPQQAYPIFKAIAECESASK